MHRVKEECLAENQLRDLKVLVDFIYCYCKCRHGDRVKSNLGLSAEVESFLPKKIVLCDDCIELLLHGIQKRRNCPVDQKPTCRKCHIHCYSGEYRAKIREIMAFSGRKMIMRGRLDYLWHYFF
jgi:hypothetical protein